MKRITAFFIVVLLTLPLSAGAADLLIAQAANFMPAMEEIIPAFEKETGIKAQATYTSTGKIYAQIINGAPFDIFLSADQKRPDKLYADGLADKPFIYALGKLVFWFKNPAISSKTWPEAALSPAVNKVAIANTESAPYGTAAMKAMQKVGIWDAMQPKLVHAQTISQAFQYAHTGSTEAGFCAYSSVFTEKGRSGKYIVVEEAPRVVQSACLLKNALHRVAAQRFVEFLQSDTVKSIRNNYGYE